MSNVGCYYTLLRGSGAEGMLISCQSECLKLMKLSEHDNLEVKKNIVYKMTGT